MLVVYHPDAAEELVEYAQFFESRVPGLGSEFLDEIDRAVTLIASAPEQYVLVRGNIRRFSIRRFPQRNLLPITARCFARPGDQALKSSP